MSVFDLNMLNYDAFTTLLILELFCNLTVFLFFFFDEKLLKGFEVMKDAKVLKFKGVWG